MIEIYTDGSCLGKTKNGGWSGVYLLNNQAWSLSGGEKNTTNNRMELKSVIKILDFVHESDSYVIYSDSMYVINGITKWIKKWRRTNYKDIKNRDLWEILDKAVENRKIEWKWVKAHNGDRWNEYVDTLARAEAYKQV
jgi:ribonuclease HI